MSAILNKMSADASSLHCPNCGAPAEPDSSRCRYCEARLATVSCPSCFALMFAGTAFCPKCGARGARAATEPADSLQCPACRKPMQRLQIGATAMLECDGCDGIWVEATTFESLCANREAQAAVIHQLAQRPASSAGKVKYRPCPRCAKMMNRVNFGRISGVVVDVCKGHGTYLDAGELHAIVQFIHDGGLERARRRQLEDLKEQERRVEEAEARLARERRRSDARTGGSVEWSFMVGDD
jgi:Zn-finger nucleic acid-binding protein